MRATWDAIPDTKIYVESVHRLSDLGAVVTHAYAGTSRDGFDAEWREVSLNLLDGDRVNRTELFDEADVDAALAGFEELHQQPRRPDNASTRVAERFLAHFAARDWDAMAEMLAADYSSEDRRSVVGAGARHGREAQMADMRAIADLWVTNATSTVIATRGERLGLILTCYSGRDQGAEAFRKRYLPSGRSTPMSEWWHTSRSIPTTSTPPLPNSTLGTSPAKPPPIRTRGPSSRGQSPDLLDTKSRL